MNVRETDKKQILDEVKESLPQRPPRSLFPLQLWEGNWPRLSYK